MVQNKDFSGKDDPRKRLLAVLNFAHDSWHLYAVGYREAANLIVIGIEQGTIPREKIDPIVYPVAFMYRHSVELWLKHLIIGCGKLLGKEINFKNSHKLGDLWEHLYQLIKDVYQELGQTEGKDEKKYIDRVEQIISQISNLDNESMAFRYPVDKKDVPYLQELKYLHLGQLSDLFNELLDDLDAISSWLQDLIDKKSEWLSEMRNFYGDIEGDLW